MGSCSTDGACDLVLLNTNWMLRKNMWSNVVTFDFPLYIPSDLNPMDSSLDPDPHLLSKTCSYCSPPCVRVGRKSHFAITLQFVVICEKWWLCQSSKYQIFVNFKCIFQKFIMNYKNSPGYWYALFTPPTNSFGCCGYDPYSAIISTGHSQKTLAYISVK